MSLYDNVRSVLETRKEWLQQAEDALRLVMDLPAEVKVGVIRRLKW